MSMMDHCKDFLSWLDHDTSLNIFKGMDDPADLARVSCVSRSWRHFVIANGLSKQLCLRMFPPLSRVACVVELNQHGVKEHPEVGLSNSMEWLALQKDNRVYGCLARCCMSPVAMDCIAGRFSYWSSNGQINPNVPETLTYQLGSQICVIKEINIQPFQAHFQMGSPIYSAQSVRFKMGHQKASLDSLADEMFVWTYTSPEFPMAQENRLQTFQLPEPVLCIGGILQVELLGRVQRQEMDGLLYICISYVQALGIQLSPAFSVEILDPSGMFVLKRDQRAKCEPHATSDDESGMLNENLLREFRDFRRLLMWEHVMRIGAENGWDEEDYANGDFDFDFGFDEDVA
ncbi:F-box protein At4g00755-like [Cicer arietinum]|uniref:F-box protein At4g00755-like n=1 Tax=Cicer arietinum TaxID=3827 RepID=A0A1S2XS05_CICAR|nr:F-box protein At4g00755-like [Cicer arietinum]